MNNNELKITAPGLFKLGACLVYEALTIIALSFVLTGVFLWLAGDASHGVKRLVMQLFLWLGIGAYFIRCWLTSGQTLAMQAWNFQLLDHDNQTLDVKLAVARYMLATLGLVLLGLGFLWAIVDKNHLFLHDRLLKTRIVMRQQ